MAYMYKKHTFQVGDLLLDDDLNKPQLPLLVLETYWESTDFNNNTPYYKVLNLQTGDIENHHKVEIELTYRREGNE